MSSRKRTSNPPDMVSAITWSSILAWEMTDW